MIEGLMLRREALHGGILETRFARKLIDESRTNDSLADDADLHFAVGPNQIWLFRAILWPDSTSTTPDFKVAVSSPTGTTGLFQAVGLTLAATGTANIVSGTNCSLNGSDDLTFGCPTTFVGTEFLFGAAIIGSEGGRIRVRWAQNTTNPTATLLKEGSFIIAYRMK